MSEPAERYARIASGFDARLRGITDDAWTRPPPCDEWTVRDVVAHVVSVHRRVAAGLDASAPSPPATDADLAAAWTAATAEIAGALADPQRATAPDPAGVTYAFEMLRPNDEAIRGAGGFGPKIDPPAGADEQTRFLCFLGRRVERQS